MLNKLAAFLRRYDLVRKGDTVICAVSGGADSMALLFAMYLLRDKLDIFVQAAHFNHCLRGEESQADEAFVREFCGRYDIALSVGRAEVTAGKKGLEAAAREARYLFFDTLEGKIATAHTADDNAETVLMHMIRGTGLKGLGGIAPQRGKLIRPMLEITRQQVLNFLAEYHIPHREDSSNAGDAFLRNRLRHHVMPLLKQENPRLAENVSSMALRLRQDEEALQETVDFSDGLPVDKLRSMQPARRSRVIAAYLQHCSVAEPEAEHIALVQALLDSDKPSAKANFPGGVTLWRCYGVVKKGEATELPAQTVLTCPGITRIPQLGLVVECSPAEQIENSKDTFTVNPVGTVCLRSRQRGDAMRLSGGSKSLKKLFIDRKIPARDRQRIPVLTDESGILGVYGIGVNLDRAAKELPAFRICIRTDGWKHKEAEEQKCTKI